MKTVQNKKGIAGSIKVYKNKNFQKTVLTAFVIVLLTFQLTNARWANYDDALMEYDFINAIYEVDKNGTYTSTTEVKAKLLKEGAREIFAKLETPSYNSARGSLKVLEAKTINQGTDYPVMPQAIEDNPVLGKSVGFDAQHQLSIAFPCLDIGASVYFKLKYTETHPVMKNHFSMTRFFGGDNWHKGGCIQMTSKLPLYVKINDPDHVLSIDLNGKKIGKISDLATTNTVHSLKVCIKKAFTNAVVTEIGSGVVSPEKLTWLSVSTINNWDDIARYFAKDYERVIAQKLPDVFEQALPVITSAKSMIDAMNEATNFLAHRIHYLGDWRTVSGGYIPRALKEIAQTQSGDCKDFAVSLTAILRKLGYHAQIALVNRGWLPQTYHYLPSEGAFNHAIVKVTSADDTVYWV